MPSRNAKEVGRRIRQARQGAGLTQQSLADQVGVTMTQVSRWERGASDARALNLERVAEVTGTPVRHFFPRPEGPEGLSLEQMMAQQLELTQTLIDAVRCLTNLLRPASNDGPQPSGERPLL